MHRDSSPAAQNDESGGKEREREAVYIFIAEGDTFPLSAAMHSEHDLHYANWICKGASAT